MKIFPNHLRVVFAAIGLIALTGCAGDRAPTASGTGGASTASGVVISDEVIEVIIAEQRAQGAPEDPNMKDGIRRELARRAMLEQDAIKAGIDKRPDTLVRQNLARQNALIRDYVQDWAKTNAPTNEELEQEYDKIIASMDGQKEFHARHILLKTEQDAKNVISRLQKGAKFAELASRSLDPGSKDNGGDLGWASPAMFAPPFSEAMTQLSKGKYTTTPVKTEYGYHVIFLEDERSIQVPPLSEIKPELQQRMQQQRWQAYVEELDRNADPGRSAEDNKGAEAVESTEEVK
ncbi:MAG: peptidylprolyl isomerase [Azoarcus sp.]|nr:peptidylprolyl isomerase [Azoarcus sp.]